MRIKYNGMVRRSRKALNYVKPEHDTNGME